MWQALYEELRDRSFMVIAVALDSRDGDPLPWIEAARPTYVTLIDRDHRLADLYHMVNVPQAVWIDERGRIVRSPEPAGAYEGFRAMNRATRDMPQAVAELTAQAKSMYVDAIRDWVLHGADSAYAFEANQARASVSVPSAATAQAQAMFRLGQLLIRREHRDEGDRWLQEASRLHPDSRCIWRQRAGVTEAGLAAQADFWARVAALGSKRYYARIDMEDMP